jgi:hypothetical protein
MIDHAQTTDTFRRRALNHDLADDFERVVVDGGVRYRRRGYTPPTAPAAPAADLDRLGDLANDVAVCRTILGDTENGQDAGLAEPESGFGPWNRQTSTRPATAKSTVAHAPQTPSPSIDEAEREVQRREEQLAAARSAQRAAPSHARAQAVRDAEKALETARHRLHAARRRAHEDIAQAAAAERRKLDAADRVELEEFYAQVDGRVRATGTTDAEEWAALAANAERIR